MSYPDILVYPDTRLRQVSSDVTEFDSRLRDFIADLEATMHAGPSAVGIAAPQVDCMQRIIIVDASSRKGVTHHGRLVMINPRVISQEGAVVGREGCLSVPDFTGNVMRAERITVEAQDESGQAQRFDMEGFEARVVLHEIDHLDGLLFIDRIVSRHDLFRRKTRQ